MIVHFCLKQSSMKHCKIFANRLILLAMSIRDLMSDSIERRRLKELLEEEIDRQIEKNEAGRSETWQRTYAGLWWTEAKRDVRTLVRLILGMCLKTHYITNTERA